MEPLVTDEIIEEIHTIRRQHAASFNFDIERIHAARFINSKAAQSSKKLGGFGCVGFG